MERLTHRYEDGKPWISLTNVTAFGEFECIGPAIDRLTAYEDFMERWKLGSIEDADRIFQRVNDLGGTDLMAQYRGLGPIDRLRDLVQAEKDGRMVDYLPGETVYDHFGMAWTVTTSEIHKFGDGPLRYLYRCGHPGTDDYCALYADEILTREEAETALKGGDSNAQT